MDFVDLVTLFEQAPQGCFALFFAGGVGADPPPADDVAVASAIDSSTSAVVVAISLVFLNEFFDHVT